MPIFPWGESRVDADSTSQLAALTFPKEFPLRLGKMLKTSSGQGKARLHTIGLIPRPPTWAALRCPQPGQPGCRQPKPAVSDPPLVAIKHSKVHEPATKATFSESKAGSECWDTGSQVSCVPPKAKVGLWTKRVMLSPAPASAPGPSPPSSPTAGRMQSDREKVMPGPLSSLPPPFINK